LRVGFYFTIKPVDQKNDRTGVGITFAAIDYGRASRIQQVVAKAADAAVFTAATRLMEGESAVRTAFDASFRTNLPDDLEKVPYRLDVASNGKSLSVELDLRIKTSLVSILGVNKIDIKVTATASRPKPKLPAAPAILDPDGDQISKRDLNDAINRSLEAFGGRSPGRAPDEEAVRQRIREIERQLRLIGSHLR